MPGLSGAAKVAKAVATSDATKQAVKNVAGSNVTKAIVSGIVIDTALPELKKRVAERLNSNSGDPKSTEAEYQELGEWNDPSHLDFDSEEYRTYLRAQFQILGSYEAHLEAYEDADFESYINSYYNSCDDLEAHLQSIEVAVRSVDGFLNHLETFAVRNDDFREFLLERSEEYPDTTSFDSTTMSDRTRLRQMDEYLSEREAYLDALLEYTAQSSAFESHVDAYDVRLVGSVSEFEGTVDAVLDYLSYLESYKKQDEAFGDHVTSFELPDQLNYQLLKAENALIKDL